MEEVTHLGAGGPTHTHTHTTLHLLLLKLVFFSRLTFSFFHPRSWLHRLRRSLEAGEAEAQRGVLACPCHTAEVGTRAELGVLGSEPQPELAKSQFLPTLA